MQILFFPLRLQRPEAQAAAPLRRSLPQPGAGVPHPHQLLHVREEGAMGREEGGAMIRSSQQKGFLLHHFGTLYSKKATSRRHVLTQIRALDKNLYSGLHIL